VRFAKQPEIGRCLRSQFKKMDIGVYVELYGYMLF